MRGIDQRNFEQLFNTWYEPIRNFLYFKAGDMNAAEDMAQDVFMKVWEKRSWIIPETIKPYLYKLAKNLFLNQQEHKKVHLKFSAGYQPGIDFESPEYQMQVKEFDKKLQDAINELDEKKRTVFLMNRVEKLTYNQIAESLGITVKAVEKRMEKVLVSLRQQIEINI